MDQITAKEALEMAFDRFNGFHVLWSFYVTVALGVIAYLGAIGQRNLGGFRYLLALGFSLFAVVNLWALYDVRDQRDLLTDHAITMVGHENVSAESIELVCAVAESDSPPYRWQLVTFHIAGDVLILGAILFSHRWFNAGAQRQE